MNHIARALWLNHGRIARRAAGKRAARRGTGTIFRFGPKHMSRRHLPLDTDGELAPVTRLRRRRAAGMTARPRRWQHVAKQFEGLFPRSRRRYWTNRIAAPQ